MVIKNNNHGNSVQVNVFMPKKFVDQIDENAKITGSSRSEFVRRSLDYYLRKMKGDIE